MIQRIQSFYLVLAVCAMALCFMFPVATFNAVNADSTKAVVSQLNLVPKASADVNTLEQIEQGSNVVEMPQKGYIKVWPLAVVAGLCGLLALVSIFLYKNRTTQVRVVACGVLLNVVYLFLIFIWAVDSFSGQFVAFASDLLCPNATTTYSVATWASIVSLVFMYLAQRAIQKDEAKVRAADRIR